MHCISIESIFDINSVKRSVLFAVIVVLCIIFTFSVLKKFTWSWNLIVYSGLDSVALLAATYKHAQKISFL